MTDDLEPRDFDPEPQILPPQQAEPDSSKRRLALGGAVIALLLLGGYGWYAFDQGDQSDVILAPPVIKAEQGPAKVEPDSPGGMDVPHQDKMVYNRVNSGASDAEAEDIIDSAEKPSSPSAAGLSLVIAPRDTKKVAPAPELPDQTAAATPSRAEVAAERAKVAAKRERAAKAAARAASSVANGNYVVQVASFRARERAEAAWGTLAKKHDDLLGFLSSDIKRADLGAKGIYYRLRVGPFADRPAASALCSNLKSRRVDCLVTKR